jgi:catechol 2,3-dioxygenase-like lactoylglutathione lyase family enzyme
LPVKQLKKTGDFYINILGFEEIEVTASQNPPKRWLMNHEGKQLHLITSDDQAPTTIINHMAFSTADLDKVVAHLQKNKVDYWTDEGKKNVVRIRKDGVRQVKIQDPEGHWIEINEAY